jgi:ATP-dependent RNA helicase SUPV3L1/SUV3
MHVAVRKPSKCALCAFRTSIWAPILAEGGGSKRYLRIRRDFQDEKKDTHYVSGFVHPVNLTISKPFRILIRLQIAQPGAERPFRISRGGRLSFGTSRRDLMLADNVPYTTLAEIITEQWSNIKASLDYWPTAALEVRAWGVANKTILDKWLGKFQNELKKECADAIQLDSKGKEPPALIRRLRNAFLASHVRGLAAALKYSLETFVLNKGFSKVALENQRALADFRYPIEWYPEARTIQRKIHLHVGPTNSGKTYQALQRLETAESGVYAGPLRLLAHEVYTRLNAKNKLCALITGEERRIPEGQEAYLTSCTVEMIPLNDVVDVAVIDEIQMMGDISRGWAWTHAFLGVKAKEVHLCGELRTVPLIEQLCAMTGDSLEIHKYERLSPLKVMKSSLKGDLRNLQKGDAIILFSRLGIHSMRKDIERVTGRRCAVVYGSLPPETRAQQASLFNDPNNDYDFLVASDAVGMGLNLSIKRIIFESTSKTDEIGFRTLQISEIKQIAGRAGRYRTAAQAVENSLSPLQEDFPPESPIDLDIVQNKSPGTVGLVTTLQNYDMPILQNAMSSEAPPLAAAGIAALDDIIARFAAYFPQSTPLSYILLRLHEISSVNPRFFLCRLRDHLDIADAIQEYDLTINDRIIFISSPASFRQQGVETVIKALAKCVASQSGGELLDIKEIDLELLDEPVDVENKEHLRKLENLHSALTLYLWLSYRFAGVFRSQALAFHVKSLLEEKIEIYLSRVQLDPMAKQWKNILQKRTALSSMKSAPKIERVDRENNENSSPFGILANLAEEKNASISSPTYVDLGQIDETEPSTWRASVSVICKGEVVQATTTGSSKMKAKWDAAEAVLQKISLGNA